MKRAHVSIPTLILAISLLLVPETQFEVVPFEIHPAVYAVLVDSGDECDQRLGRVHVHDADSNLHERRSQIRRRYGELRTVVNVPPRFPAMPSCEKMTS